MTQPSMAASQPIYGDQPPSQAPCTRRHPGQGHPASQHAHPPSLSQRAAADKADKASKKKPAKKEAKGPKRPLSAYMFFSQDWRERVKAENPDASFGEIGKLLGARWKELDDEEKKVRARRSSSQAHIC